MSEGSTRKRSNDFSMIIFSNARMRRRGGGSTTIYAPRSGICLSVLRSKSVIAERGPATTPVDEELRRFDENMKNVRGLHRRHVVWLYI